MALRLPKPVLDVLVGGTAAAVVVTAVALVAPAVAPKPGHTIRIQKGPVLKTSCR